mmetsp:Transcript_20084/g.27150  ORF Transcript_20084/g.27150 Transcript_20084/m.27150 type:complete len:237 (-) Transcript_20084:149-859(-)
MEEEPPTDTVVVTSSDTDDAGTGVADADGVVVSGTGLGLAEAPALGLGLAAALILAAALGDTPGLADGLTPVTSLRSTTMYPTTSPMCARSESDTVSSSTTTFSTSAPTASSPYSRAQLPSMPCIPLWHTTASVKLSAGRSYEYGGESPTPNTETLPRAANTERPASAPAPDSSTTYPSVSAARARLSSPVIRPTLSAADDGDCTREAPDDQNACHRGPFRDMTCPSTTGAVYDWL